MQNVRIFSTNKIVWPLYLIDSIKLVIMACHTNMHCQYTNCSLREKTRAHRRLSDDVPLAAKNARMRAALAVYREIAAELNAESALVVSNCGSALIKFCHRIAAASLVPMCIYMQLPWVTLYCSFSLPA